MTKENSPVEAAEKKKQRDLIQLQGGLALRNQVREACCGPPKKSVATRSVKRTREPPLMGAREQMEPTRNLETTLHGNPTAPGTEGSVEILHSPPRFALHQRLRHQMHATCQQFRLSTLLTTAHTLRGHHFTGVGRIHHQSISTQSAFTSNTCQLRPQSPCHRGDLHHVRT